MTIRKTISPHDGYDRYEIRWQGSHAAYRIEYRMEGGEWVDHTPTGGIEVKPDPPDWGECKYHLDIYRTAWNLVGIRVGHWNAGGLIAEEMTIE